MDLFEDDNDYELIQFLNYQRRVYTVHQRLDHFEKWDDHDFRVRFRLGKDVVLQVVEYIEDEISSQSNRNNAVTTINKLLLTLRFYATGNFLITAGDFMGLVLIVRDVSVSIAKLQPRFIRMPETETEIRNLQRRFFQIARFPRTIGAIDCTHIKIQNPGGPNGEYFRNRKGYFSLNVQTISCPDLKIMDVVARWPGSCHDQTSFKKSRIYYKLVSADSGYANSQYVVTTYLNPQNDPEGLYNESLIRTRNPVERSYGVLKRRFPIL
ncbi:Uncharacterized protein FWK35_00023526 [Aphis craccivora]|uniref:DDE Tnp4 domain-containing protein n=1 Tax=Aphis craccivora TaxID=307492 RepID=A0A6G0VRC9_APHCR|nr:Uncharacterized protein FWK35_00023526 [Aphis craccivora]